MQTKCSCDFPRMSASNGNTSSALSIFTVESWGNTDSEQSHEFVEIIIALGSAGVFTAVVSVVKAWLERDKIQQVELVSLDGKNRITMTKAKAADVVDVAKAIGYKMSTPVKSQRRRQKS